MSIFEGLERGEIRITDFQRRIINDHRVRVSKLQELIEKAEQLKTKVSKELVDQLKSEVINSKRYLETKDLDSEGLQALRSGKETEDRVLGILESDIFRLKKQASELPIGPARDELLLFLNEIQNIKEPIIKLNEINLVVEKLMQELEVIIEKERETLEGIFNLLINMGVKKYEDCENEVEGVIGKLNYFGINLKREEENIVLPLKALLDQKKEVHIRIEELRSHFESTQNELRLEQIKDDLRNLNPLQAKEYLDNLEKILNQYLRKRIRIKRIKEAYNFLTRFKKFFERKRERIQTEKEIQSAERLSKTKELARIDPLTGLKNRRAMDEELEIRLKQLFRNGGALGFIMIDIDHFKSVNDTWGHPVGDVALKIVVEAVKESLRTGDSAFRYGGEEIAVIITNNPSEENLLIIGNRMRGRVTQKIEEEKIRNKVLAKIGERKITISLGAACMHLGKRKDSNSNFIEEQGVELKSRADQMLYVAKNNGRDQIRISRIDI